MARRLGDNGELATRGMEGTTSSWTSVEEAAARAVAREMFEPLDDGGGTLCFIKDAVGAPPRERRRINIVARRAGA